MIPVSLLCTIMRHELHVQLANRYVFTLLPCFMLHIELSHRSQYTEILEAATPK